MVRRHRRAVHRLCDDDEQGGGHGTASAAGAAGAAGAVGAAGAPRLPPLPPELRRRWRHWTCEDGGARRCGAWGPCASIAILRPLSSLSLTF